MAKKNRVSKWPSLNKRKARRELDPRLQELHRLLSEGEDDQTISKFLQAHLLEVVPSKFEGTVRSNTDLDLVCEGFVDEAFCAELSFGEYVYIEVHKMWRGVIGWGEQGQGSVIYFEDIDRGLVLAFGIESDTKFYFSTFAPDHDVNREGRELAGEAQGTMHPQLG